MNQLLQSSKSFEELLTAAPSAAAPYDFAMIFQPEGMFGKSREKRRLALLKALDERIQSLLEGGEQVRMVSHGMENSIFEQMFLGWAAYFMNMVAFVLTDRRLLMLQITTRRKPKTFIRQYRFEALREIDVSMTRALKVVGADRKKSVFSGLPGKDGKRLAALLRESATYRPDVHIGKQNVCPTCYAPVAGVPAACACGQQFKSPRVAGALSLLFPGFGDLYLGHYAFATMEILAGMLLWSVISLDLMDPALNAYPLSVTEALLSTATVLVPLLHVPDAIVTWRIGLKGLVKRGHKPQAVIGGTNATQWKQA